MVNLTVLTLITGNLLIIKPPPHVYQVQVQYYPSNTAKVEDEGRWYPMESSLFYGHHITSINITSEKMFLFTKYRLFFNNRSIADTDWELHIWNRERLADYFLTCTIVIWTLTVISISIIGLIVYKFKK